MHMEEFARIGDNEFKAFTMNDGSVWLRDRYALHGAYPCLVQPKDGGGFSVDALVPQGVFSRVLTEFELEPDNPIHAFAVEAWNRARDTTSRGDRQEISEGLTSRIATL